MRPAINGVRLARILGPAPWSYPVYAAVVGAIRAAVDDGRLPAGTRLPSERELTAALGLSRTTVTRVYAELRASGYLSTRRGSGSVVHLPDASEGRVDHLLAPGRGSAGLDLSCAAPGAPPAIRAAYHAAVERLGGYLAGSGYYPFGLPLVRENLAQRYTDRGLPTDPGQIVVTGGALAGLAMAVRAVVGAGDRVVVESPTYPNAIGGIEGARARVVAHPIEWRRAGEEWELDGLETLIRQVGARAAYLIPDFQNPTGALMDLRQRERVAALLRRHRVLPIIDESLVDLGLDIEPPPPLAAFTSESISIGSASKSFWGGLRVGWLRVPRRWREAVVEHRLRLDLSTSVVDQLALTEVLEREDALLAERRALLRHARDLLTRRLSAELPDWRVNRPPGGMALWCELPAPRSRALAVAARYHGVTLAAGANFAPGGGLDSWMRVPYSLEPGDLVDVVPRLAAAWAEATSGNSPRAVPDVPIIA